MSNFYFNRFSLLYFIRSDDNLLGLSWQQIKEIITETCSLIRNLNENIPRQLLSRQNDLTFPI